MGWVGVGLELEWGGLRRWRSSPTAFLMEWARKAKLELRGVEVGVVLELHICVGVGVEVGEGGVEVGVA